MCIHIYIYTWTYVYYIQIHTKVYICIFIFYILHKHAKTIKSAATPELVNHFGVISTPYIRNSWKNICKIIAYSSYIKVVGLYFNYGTMIK